MLIDIADLELAFKWWLTLLSLGVLFLPLTSMIFSSFFDKGYIFSKILSTALLSYFIWLIVSLKILPFGSAPILITLVIFLIINLGIVFKGKNIWLNLPSGKILIAEELLFTIGFFIWAYIRSFEPSIQSLEKFMDFGFINSTLKSNYFPPQDLWMAPLTINYYYFGHAATAFIIRLSEVNPFVGYNLMLSTLFALTLTASFSIGANLFYLFTKSQDLIDNLSSSVKSVLVGISGFLSAYLVTLGGNLQTIYIFFKKGSAAESPPPFWELPFTLTGSDYWYPDATRFIPFTIHEFPIYSFIVADLHGHLLNLPFILLYIAVLIAIFYQPKIDPLRLGLMGLLVGIFLMTNILDGPIYLLAAFIVITAKYLTEHQFPSSIWQGIKYSSLIITLAIILSLPFWISFKPFSSGIGVMCAPNFLTNLGHLGPFLFEADHCSRSYLWMLAILYGFFYLVISGFAIIYLRTHRPVAKSDYLIIGLIITSTILIVTPEFVYVKDIYPSHYRANTVFKLAYQAFVMLGLGSGYMIAKLISYKKTPKAYLLTIYLLFLLLACYPLIAVRSYYKGLETSVGLNGLEYLNSLYPNDYEAINWINTHIPNQPVILEAVGESYTNYARISANTALPTVLGWPTHEWLWRGKYDETVTRTQDVKTIYETTDQNLALDLMKKYNISYIYIGQLEKDKYPNLQESKFLNLGSLVFSNTGARVYKVNLATP